MPRAPEHLAHAQRIDGTMQYLLQDTPTHLEWVVTTAFYQAVHYVEAFFATEGHHSEKHQERFDRLKKACPITYALLSKLESQSRKARYLAGVKGAYAAHMQVHRVKPMVIDGWLAQVKQLMQGRIEAATQA